MVKGADKFEEIALKALEADSQRAGKAKAVENLVKRVIKSGPDGKVIKAKAKEIF